VRSKELKVNEEGDNLEKWKRTKNRNKSKTVEQGKPTNSQIIREISPEDTNDGDVSLDSLILFTIMVSSTWSSSSNNDLVYITDTLIYK